MMTLPLDFMILSLHLYFYLQARDDHLNKVMEEARLNLSRISGDAVKYPSILKGLILQVLLSP